MIKKWNENHCSVDASLVNTVTKNVLVKKIQNGAPGTSAIEWDVAFFFLAPWPMCICFFF
jgi:hypothetical protein